MPARQFPSPTWPGSALIEQLGLATPLLAIDLDQLNRRARSNLDEHRRHKIAWHPALPPTSAFSEIQALQDAGITAFSVTTLPEIPLIPDRPSRINLLRPPVVGGGPARLAVASNTWEITVACDHFAQAERLVAARQAGRALLIDLRIDVGSNRWGVSPGAELRDLARGISRLPGTKLRGLLLPDRSGARIADPPGMHDEEFIRLAITAMNSLRAAGHEPELLLVDTLEAALLLRGAIRDVPLAARTPLPADHSLVIAGVIARPLRETAILDAGRSELGPTPTLPAKSSWHIETVCPDFTMLRCDTGKQELGIGDALPICPSHNFEPPAAMPRLVLRDGTWNRALAR